MRRKGQILMKFCRLVVMGMNSVSEAIHYAVPLICIPLSGDQNFVAWRVADELGIGIRLCKDNNLTCDMVKSSIRKILGDKSYLEKMNVISQVSKKYAGSELAVKYLIEHWKKNNPV